MMTTNVTALCSQWSTAREKLSLAMNDFEAACNALGALGLQAGILFEPTQPGFLPSLEVDLPSLTQEIARMVSSLAALKKVRNGSTQLISINRLPPETLASIFSVVINTGRSDWYHDQSFGPAKDFTYTISSVSSYWRHVCLTTPVLWTQIRIYGKHWWSRAVLWLERSRSCPLSLFSRIIYRCTEKDVDRLFEHSDIRFKSLVINIGARCYLGEKILHAACAQFHEFSVKLASLGIIAYDETTSDVQRRITLPPKHQMDQYLKSVRTRYVKVFANPQDLLMSFYSMNDPSSQM